MGSGIDSLVNALTVYNGEIVAGGDFDIAGEYVSVNWARWGPSDACPFDIAPSCGDRTVNVDEIIHVIGEWGTNVGQPADFTDDGIVNVSDLLSLLNNWGPCP